MAAYRRRPSLALEMSQLAEPGSRSKSGRGVVGGLAIAMLGGAVALGLALLVGAVHTGSGGGATTTVVQTPVSSPAGTVSGWTGVYAAANPGTVDVTVQTTSSTQGGSGPGSGQQETALGSGFVLDTQGDIVTAAHVVENASSIRIAFLSGATRSAALVGKDNAADVAVVRVDPAGLVLHPLSLGRSATLAVGDPLAVLGNPLGFDRSLSTGVVSALDRTIQAPNGFEIAHAIQTDAALNPGNSGGPVLNRAGQIIGIADQIATGINQFGSSTTQTSTGVGFAVPIDLIRHELPALLRGQTVAHAYLGISTGQTVNGESGALVAGVASGGPAAAAGLKPGDVIVVFDGTPIQNNGDLIDAIAAAHPGQQVHLTVRRGSSRFPITVTLGTQPAQAPSQ
jgi:putative serine protease PepD